jgi:predicted peptidase
MTTTSAEIPDLREQANRLFSKHRYVAKGGSLLNYRLYSPTDISDSEKVPLVLFFHGAGERGRDNDSQLNHGVPSILDYVIKRGLRAVIVAPQCPPEELWVDTVWGEESHRMAEDPTAPMKSTIELLRMTVRDLPIDSARVVVTGISMGGFATWEILQRHPEMFAAAIPVCGGGDLEWADRIVSVPVHVFHGGADDVVLPVRSRSMVEALRALGGSPRYTEYEGVGHDSWTETYSNTSVLSWLFAQK